MKRKGSETIPEPTVVKTDEQWRNDLTPAQYEVLRKASTDRPFSGKYYDCHDDGIYRCAGCDAELFRSDTKFESGTGWPSFTDPINSEAVTLVTDRSMFMSRTEVLCRACGGHLGHVFDDGPAPSGQRFCMNSSSLDLDRRAPAGPASDADKE